MISGKPYGQERAENVLRHLLDEGERIARYSISSLNTNFVNWCYCISPDEDGVDILLCLEDTLHRLLDAESEDFITEREKAELVCSVMGLRRDGSEFCPLFEDDEERDWDNVTLIDQGYGFFGEIDAWELI